MNRGVSAAFWWAFGGCNPLECGSGTIERDGLCVDASLDCGEGAVLLDDVCVGGDLQYVPFPFPEGTEATISQGNHGYLSHTGSSAFAVDFICDEGTAVAGVRTGRVRDVREDSDSGCAEEECADQANYVLVDHGDGTIAKYFHLQLDGALVERDDVVWQGQSIGLSGNTGWSTGPHVHLEIDDLFGWSLPLRFDELAAVSEGVPFPGAIAESSNRATEPTDEGPDFSFCASDTFLARGVELASEVPCSVAERDRSYPVEGWAWSEDKKVMVARYSPDAASWDYDCTATDDDGWFETEVTWESDGFDDSSYLMITAAQNDCTAYSGWDSSVLVTLR